MDYKFYSEWKNKTPQERKYIKSLEKALAWLKKQKFAKDIIAVYVKGSFVFRELTSESDIDTLVVVKNRRAFDLLKESRDKCKGSLKPVDILRISINELRKNERIDSEEMRGRPDQDIIFLHYFKQVYGKPLDASKFKVRNEKEVYEALRSFIINKALPAHYNKQFGFRQIGKKFMHLVYWEERLKGNVFEPSWRAIIEACPDNELLKRTWEYRLKPTNDEKKREKYIQDLVRYVGK